jgi:proteasome accessory factor B
VSGQPSTAVAARKRPTVPAEQRVFSLILALVSSPIGATKRDLLRSVHGYAEDFIEGGDLSALERKFERDKGELRRIGIPIETLDSPSEQGNNQLTRYRIVKDRLQIPETLRFAPRELTLLRLAALSWRDGSLSEDSRRAAMKLEALGAALDVQHLGVAPRIGIPEPAASDLRRAITDSRTVTFDYQHPEHGAPLHRHIAPLRLHRADGRWHLIGWDIEREAGRVFLLSRIVGAPVVRRDRIDRALLARTDQLVAEIEILQRTQVAEVDVRRGSSAEARLRPRACSEVVTGDSVRLTLGMLDSHFLADELVGYGADVAAVAPQILRDRVVERLRKIIAAHTGGRHAN